MTSSTREPPLDWEPPEKPAATLETAELSELSSVERLKAASQGLFFVAGREGAHAFRSEIEELGRDERSTLSNEAKELSKFFGIYRQQLRGERGRKTGDQIFMVRVKNPSGGLLSREQWLALDEASDLYADGTLRLTSRQGVQFHHVRGPGLGRLVRHLNRRYRPGATLGACGDVGRNTMTSPLDGLDPEFDPHGRELANAIAEELAPKSSAYFQIWMSDEQGAQGRPVNPDEPFYGPQYLPRKFKVGLAHPRDNSIDVLTQDVGLVPVVVDGRCDGSLWDLYSGGGMGLTHNNAATAPLLALYHGRIRRDQVLPAVKAIAELQRRHGERRDRRLARWKYTLRRLGLERVNQTLASEFGIPIESATPAALPPVELLLGWHALADGAGFYGVSVENGRVGPELRKGLCAAVEELDLSVKITAHQDVLLCGARDPDSILRILDARGVPRPETLSRVRRLAMACPAKPTCGLAMTEAERSLPGYVDALEAAGLGDVDVEIRMTGCPNGCVRPPTAEIGIYGYGKNDHVILVGGSRRGDRLGKRLYARIPEEQMVSALVGLLRAVRDRNHEGLAAGDFLWRADPADLRRWIGIEEAS